MISWQGEEVEHLNSTLASLRQQLMQTVEDYERARMSLEAKHKARTFCVTACHVHLVAKYSVRVRTLHVYLYWTIFWRIMRIVFAGWPRRVNAANGAADKGGREPGCQRNTQGQHNLHSRFSDPSHSQVWLPLPLLMQSFPGLADTWIWYISHLLYLTYPVEFINAS